MVRKLKLYFLLLGIPFVVYIIIGLLSWFLYKAGGCSGGLGSGTNCIQGRFFALPSTLFTVSSIIILPLYLIYSGACTLGLFVWAIVDRTHLAHRNTERTATATRQELPRSEPSDYSPKGPSNPKIGLISLAVWPLVAIGIFVFISISWSLLRSSGAVDRIAGMLKYQDLCKKSQDYTICLGKVAAAKQQPELCDINGLYQPTCFNSYAATVSSPDACRALIKNVVSAADRTDSRFIAYRLCLARFPDSVQLTELCSRAWTDEDYHALIGAKCWRKIGANERSPKSGNNFLMSFFLAKNSMSTDFDEILTATTDVNATNNRGETVLHLMHNDHFIYQVLAKNADLNRKNLDGLTPPMTWILNGNVNILVNIISSLNSRSHEASDTSRRRPNLDINIRTKQGESLLHLMARHWNNQHDALPKPYEIEIAKGLVLAGLDPNEKDLQGQSAIEAAKMNQRKALFE